METVSDFLFLGSKITVDGHCRHEIRRHLPLGRKAMTNLNSILRSRDITLPTKIRLVKAMVFPVVMYGCESDFLEKTLMLGKIEGRRGRGQQRKKMTGWHHQLEDREFEQALGVGDGQGSLVWCNPWGCKESDTTEQLN